MFELNIDTSFLKDLKFYSAENVKNFKNDQENIFLKMVCVGEFELFQRWQRGQEHVLP